MRSWTNQNTEALELSAANPDYRSRWRKITDNGDRPAGRIGHTVTASPDGIVYMYGGVNDAGDGSNFYISDFHSYNIATNMWTKLDISGDRLNRKAFHTMVWYDDKMVVFGGCNNRGRFNEVQIVGSNLHGQRVYTGNNVPSPRYCHSAVVYNHKMYIFGGKCGWRSSGMRVSDMHALDLRSYEWEVVEAGETYPPSRSSHTAVVYKDKMLVFGGRVKESECCDDLFEYNFLTNQWRMVLGGPGPFARARNSSVLHDDRIYMFGGFNGRRKSNDMVSFNLITDAFEMIHSCDENDPDLPSRRECHAAVVLNNKMLLIGGRHRGEFVNDMHEFAFPAPSLRSLCIRKLASGSLVLDDVLRSMNVSEGMRENVLSYTIRHETVASKLDRLDEFRNACEKERKARTPSVLQSNEKFPCFNQWRNQKFMHTLQSVLEVNNGQVQIPYPLEALNQHSEMNQRNIQQMRRNIDQRRSNISHHESQAWQPYQSIPHEPYPYDYMARNEYYPQYDHHFHSQGFQSPGFQTPQGHQSQRVYYQRPQPRGYAPRGRHTTRR